MGGLAAVFHPQSPPTAASCPTYGRLRRRISPGESAYGGLLS